jgi:hypothetical protein
MKKANLIKKIFTYNKGSEVNIMAKTKNLLAQENGQYYDSMSAV